MVYFIDDFNKEYAKKYCTANQEAIENIEKIIKNEKIECDFKRQNAYVFTKDKAEIQKIKDEVEAVKAIGGQAELVKSVELPIKGILRSNRISKSSNV